MLRLLPAPFCENQTLVEQFHHFFSRFSTIANRTYIPAIYSVSGAVGTSVYVLEEYVSGVSLPQSVEQRRTSSTPVRDVVDILAKVCEALHHAHQKEIFHLCVTPDDILIEETTGKVKLVGFGTQIFCAADRLKMWPESSKSYIAPEMMRGTDFGPYSDVYSLAVAIKKAFPELLDSGEFLNKALSSNPAERYQRARQLEDKLSEITRNTHDRPREERPAPTKKPVGGLQPVLRIITEPVGASVKVDGSSKGVTTRTGLIVPWSQGMVVFIEKVGYEPETLNFRSPPEKTEIKLRLRPTAAPPSIPVPETTRPHEVSLIERRIARLVEESEVVEERKDWRAAIEIYEDILMLSPGREDVERLLQRARKKFQATSSKEPKRDGPDAVPKAAHETDSRAYPQPGPLTESSHDGHWILWWIAIGVGMFIILAISLAGHR